VFNQRSWGVVSFYVTDFTQVGNNVTRHLTFTNLDRKMKLRVYSYYLGLDHVGHNLGGETTKIGEKLRNGMNCEEDTSKAYSIYRLVYVYDSGKPRND
ncbi:hypothetical protein PFISCL1PPCAC_7479, partial [Pristionchus fissidentatus]